MNSARDVKKIFIKRLFRIYPLYVSALLLFLLTSEISRRTFFSALCFLNIIFNIPTPTLWFISMILVHYLMIAIILYNYSIKRTIVVCALFIVVSIFMHKYFNIIDTRLISYFPSFILGLVSAKHSAISKYIRNKILMFTCLGILLFTMYYSHLVSYSWISSISIPPLIICSESFIKKINQQFFIKFSYASYCMYIYHRIIYKLLLKIYHPHTNLLTIIYLGFIGIPFLYYISLTIQNKYDNFLLKLYK